MPHVQKALNHHKTFANDFNWCRTLSKNAEGAEKCFRLLAAEIHGVIMRHARKGTTVNKKDIMRTNAQPSATCAKKNTQTPQTRNSCFQHLLPHWMTTCQSIIIQQHYYYM